jgi:hypothetical protein
MKKGEIPEWFRLSGLKSIMSRSSAGNCGIWHRKDLSGTVKDQGKEKHIPINSYFPGKFNAANVAHILLEGFVIVTMEQKHAVGVVRKLSEAVYGAAA